MQQNLWSLSDNWSPFALCRAFLSQENVFLLFKGHLSNLNQLRQMYGINKAVSEELLIIEMYRTLRDRAPYPADVAVKHLEGSFGFVLFDQNSNTVFAATVSFSAGLSKPLRVFLVVVETTALGIHKRYLQCILEHDSHFRRL